MYGSIFCSVIAAVLVVRAGWGPRPREFASFVVAYGPVGAEARSMVRRALCRDRRFRLGGAAVGIVLGLVGRSDWLPIDSTATLMIGAGGYVVGSYVAALRPDVGVGNAVRQASVVPRRIRSYVSAPALGAHVGLLVLCIAATLVRLAEEHWPSPRPRPSGLDAWGAPLLVLAAGGVSLVTVRRVVERPAPAVSRSVVDADGALRAWAVQRLTGWALMVEILLTLGSLLAMSFDAGTGRLYDAELWFDAGVVVTLLALAWRQRRASAWWRGVRPA